jgi:HlyD family secretion protein
VVRATSDGVVLRSNLRNSGQVVQAKDILIEISPRNSALVVKARVATQNVDKVTAGQTVQLRINACPYPDYGTLSGTVRAVSPDAIIPMPLELGVSPVNSNQNYYEVTIQPSQMVLTRGNRRCPLQPGMEAEANIISRQETFLQMVLRNVKLLADR